MGNRHSRKRQLEDLGDHIPVEATFVKKDHTSAVRNTITSKTTRTASNGIISNGDVELGNILNSSSTGLMNQPGKFQTASSTGQGGGDDQQQAQQQEIMKRFFEHVESVKSTIDTVTNALKRIKQLQKHLKLAVSEMEDKRIMQEITTLILKTNTDAADAKSLLSLLKEENKKYEEEKSINDSNLRIRENLVNTLSRKFIDEMKEYQNAQQALKVKKSWKKEIDLGNLGVSVHFLQNNFLNEVRNFRKKGGGFLFGRGLNDSSTIYDIEDLGNLNENGVVRSKGLGIKCPITNKKGAAYVHCLSGEDNVGQATHMLSYTWGYKIGDIVETLVNFCNSNGLDPKRTYIWICFLCVNQHRVIENRKNGINTPFTEFRDLFQKRVTDIGHILIMMAPWNDPVYLKRVWCILELYTANIKSCKIDIVMPEREHLALASTFMKDTDGAANKLFEAVSSIDVKNADAFAPADRECILKLVEDNPGYTEFNKIISRLMRHCMTKTLHEIAAKNGKMKRRKIQLGFNDLELFQVNLSQYIVKCVKFDEKEFSSTHKDKNDLRLDLLESHKLINYVLVPKNKEYHKEIWEGLKNLSVLEDLLQTAGEDFAHPHKQKEIGIRNDIVDSYFEIGCKMLNLSFQTCISNKHEYINILDTILKFAEQVYGLNATKTVETLFQAVLDLALMIEVSSIFIDEVEFQAKTAADDLEDELNKISKKMVARSAERMLTFHKDIPALRSVAEKCHKEITLLSDKIFEIVDEVSIRKEKSDDFDASVKQMFDDTYSTATMALEELERQKNQLQSCEAALDRYDDSKEKLSSTNFVSDKFQDKYSRQERIKLLLKVILCPFATPFFCIHIVYDTIKNKSPREVCMYCLILILAPPAILLYCLFQCIVCCGFKCNSCSNETYTKYLKGTCIDHYLWHIGLFDTNVENFEIPKTMSIDNYIRME